MKREKVKNGLVNQSKELDPKIEMLALESLMESVLRDENYETAIIIKSRLDELYMEESIKNS